MGDEVEVSIPETKEQPEKKPLVKVSRPDQSSFNKELEQRQKQIDEWTAKFERIKERLASKSQGKGEHSEAQKAIRQKLEDIRAEKNRIQKEKDALSAQSKEASDMLTKLITAATDLRKRLSFQTEELIDAEIRKLEFQHSTTSMSLADEKRLMGDIQKLVASKPLISQYKEHNDAIGKQKEVVNALNAQFKVSNNKWKAVRDLETEQVNKLKELAAQRENTTSEVPQLLQEKEAAKKQLDEHYAAMRKLKEEHRNAERAFLAYQRELEKLKREQRRQEWLAKEDERKARQAEREAEEAMRIPWEEEMILCDQLVAYLERLLPKEESTEEKPAAAPVAADGFAVLVNKKNREENFYFAPKKGGKKQEQKQQAGKKAPASKPLHHSLDVLAHFSLIGLVPPTTTANVSASIDEVKAKKEFYKTAPRPEKKGRTAKKAEEGAAESAETQVAAQSVESKSEVAEADKEVPTEITSSA
eukprot:GILK01000590.1.p1 GENE.GILK01000590.1~~GILK01000590.1.p1  ORF type:complete len:496 (+),score=114.04 GILK01000590.1:69-1490(+)